MQFSAKHHKAESLCARYTKYKKAFRKEEENKIINDYANCENHSYEKKQFWEHKCENLFRNV
jgi:hypothetical protein